MTTCFLTSGVLAVACAGAGLRFHDRLGLTRASVVRAVGEAFSAYFAFTCFGLNPTAQLIGATLVLAIVLEAAARLKNRLPVPQEFIWTLAVGLFGYFVVHVLDSERDRLSRQRELRTGYLLEAYRKIETVCARKDPGKLSARYIRGIESAFADIQLLGTQKQIELAKESIREIEQRSQSDPRILLIDLRNELRGELQLPPLSTDPADVEHFRIEKMLHNPPVAQPGTNP